MWKALELKEFFERIRLGGRPNRLQMKTLEFKEFFEGMKEKQKQLKEGNAPLDDALELLSQELRRDMGCPDGEELCGLVDGRLREKKFRRWLDVWHHEQIARCPSCERDIKDLEAILPPTESAEPTTLGEVLKRATQRHNLPDALALKYKRDDKWHSISSKKLFWRARAVALGLYSLGVRRGDRVALMSENCPEWTITDAGCQLAGVVDVAIPPKSEPEDVRDALIETGARSLFIRNRAAYARIAWAIEDCATLERVVFFDEGGAHEAGLRESSALTLAEVEAGGRALDAEQPTLAEELAQAVRPRDLATLIYTSGTTGKKGKPKLVMLTQENLVSNILACHERFAPMFNYRESKDRSLFSLPIWHAPGRIALYVFLHQGVRVDYAESEIAKEPESLKTIEPESLKTIFDNINKRHPTVVIGTPALFVGLREQIKKAEGGEAKGSLLAWAKASLLAWAIDIGKKWAQCQCWPQPLTISLVLKKKLFSLAYRRLALALNQKIVSRIFPRLVLGGRIRLLISVEMTLPDEIAWFYKGVGLPIIQGYGLTETSPVIAIGNPKDKLIGTVGCPLKDVDVRLSPKDEIEVRGPNVMVGYYNRTDLTDKAFTEDGWLRTDDRGEWVTYGRGIKGKNRYLKITPHGKVIYHSVNRWVSRDRIEAAIKALPIVDQALVNESSDGKPLAIKIWPNYERLLSDMQLKGIEANAEDKLCKDIQSQVASLPECRGLNIRVVLASPGEELLTTFTDKPVEEARKEHIV